MLTVPDTPSIRPSGNEKSRLADAGVSPFDLGTDRQVGPPFVYQLLAAGRDDRLKTDAGALAQRRRVAQG